MAKRKIRIVTLDRAGRYGIIESPDLSALHDHHIIDVIGLDESLKEKVSDSDVGQPYGVAGLDADAKVIDQQLHHWIKDKFKIHEQLLASKHWIIEHDFGRRPNILITDSSWYEVQPHEIKINDQDKIEVFFLQSLSGYAILT